MSTGKGRTLRVGYAPPNKANKLGLQIPLRSIRIRIFAALGRFS
jgi:hypothetical protein